MVIGDTVVSFNKKSDYDRFISLIDCVILQLHRRSYCKAEVKTLDQGFLTRGARSVCRGYVNAESLGLVI